MLTRLLFLFLLLLFFSHLGYSQRDTTIYYKANNKPALCKKDAIRCIKVRKKKKGLYSIKTLNKKDNNWKQSKLTQDVYIQNNFLIKIKVKDGNLITGILRHYTKEGQYFRIRDFDTDQNLLLEGMSRSILIPDWEGQVITYFKSGEVKSIAHYENNQLVSSEW